jgi:hypothetical protein
MCGFQNYLGKYFLNITPRYNNVNIEIDQGYGGYFNSPHLLSHFLRILGGSGELLSATAGAAVHSVLFHPFLSSNIFRETCEL